MNGKQSKKIKRYVNRERAALASQSWDMFFEFVSNLKLRKRLRLAWMIVLGKNIREEAKEKNGV